MEKLRLNTYRVAWRAFVLALIFAADLSAAIRPSLDIAFSSWNATDILVLAPTPEPGKFRVVETIKGETQPNTVLVLKGLTPPSGLATPLSELANRGLWSRPSEEPFEDVPPVREIDRIVVFLRRSGTLPEYNPRPDLPVNTEGWQPADFFGGMRTSAVWLQDGVAYGFRQTMNPGPSHLVTLWSNGGVWGEPAVRTEIGITLRKRQEFDNSLKNPDAAARANLLANFVKNDHGIAGLSARRHLEGEGQAAATALQEMLADETLMQQYPELLDALLKTGVRTFDFSTVMQREIAYWSEKCSSLQPAWWNDTSSWPAVEIPRSHYVRVYAVLQAIRRLNLKEAIPVVQVFFAVWNTCPPLDARGQLERSQVSEELRFLLSPAFR